MKIKRHNRLKPNEIFLDETIFATQNRYLGIRGCFEEGNISENKTIRGTYINGFYETHDIKYEEKAFGFPEYGESIVNLPDAQTIQVKIGHEVLSPKTCKVLDLKRTYNLEKGFTERIITYKSSNDHKFTLTFKRIASLKIKELFMIDVNIHSDNYNGPITIVSSLNGDVENYKDLNDPRIASSHTKKLDIETIEANDDYGIIVSRTKNTNFHVCSLITHDQDFAYHKDYKQIVGEKTIHLTKTQDVSFRKYALYFNDLDHNDYINQCINTIENAKVTDIYQCQYDELKIFWDFSKIDISDDQNPKLNSSIHYNLYQLYTSGGGNPRVNIPAKGLSGEGYEGHTFWDTEIYMLPYFMQVNTDLAKSLLTNRYRQIDKAKAEAKKLGVNQGIKFAWRTISGKETSPYFLAGQAQYHINSDIAYSFIKNYQLHNDENYFIEYGLPVLIETSRFFSDIVVKKNNHYHIHNVTGPDEYTTMVNNNYYTNSMIKYQLNFLVEFLNDKKSKVKNTIESYHLSKDEIELFDLIAKNIYLPFDKDLNIDLQDDSFLTKEKWDFKKTSKENYPLLLHYHPLKIYRHQVLKQPDAVLSHFLLNERPLDIMKSSFNYYEPLTTHDSSLSRCIHALQAARLGDAEKSYNYFIDTVYLDLNNVQKNTEYGLHVANLGGVYLTLLNGFLGLNISDNISMKPNLPKHIKYLNMNIRLYDDTIINVDLNHSEIVLKTNKTTKIILDDEEVNFSQTFKKKLINDN